MSAEQLDPPRALVVWQQKLQNPAYATAVKKFVLEPMCDLGSKKDDDITDATNIGIVAQYLCHMPNLQIIDLSCSNIGDSEVSVLSSILPQFSTLYTLILNNNSIGNDGAKVLATALKSLHTLSVICLNQNNIGNDGIRCLGSVFSNLTKLCRIEIHHNKYGKQEAESFIDQLHGFKYLVTCLMDHVRDAQIREDVSTRINAITSFYQQNSNIKILLEKEPLFITKLIINPITAELMESDNSLDKFNKFEKLVQSRRNAGTETWALPLDDIYDQFVSSEEIPEVTAIGCVVS